MEFELRLGSVKDEIAKIPSESVDSVVTSPPYWGLRKYGSDENEIGNERTFREYIQHLLEVFDDIKRILKPEGTVWVNLGDSYQNKSLVGIPWRFAFAMQDAGWYLRGDHVWAKPNGMPESVKDRPARSHEYVLMFTKQSRYFYDSEAVRTAPKASTVTRLMRDVGSQRGSDRANGGAKTNGTMKAVIKGSSDKQRGHSRKHAGFNERWDKMSREEQMMYGANLRSVWWVPPAQCKESHFAVMPNMVAEICIKAGCPENGLVLDPFNGAGTTGIVAFGLGRRYLGIELYPEYVEITNRRFNMAYPLRSALCV
jgi:DNA modification methylase